MTALRTTRRRGGRPRWRRAFTLVELLVVMVIIAMLSAMVLGALFSAYDTAKLAKTKATIAKIHNQLAHRWDSYRTRRLPLTFNFPNNIDNNNPQTFAVRRLRALWALQRVEMPDDYSDIKFDATDANEGGDIRFAEFNSNALRQAYQQALIAYGVDITTMNFNKPNASAECLYLTVTVGMNPDDEVRFFENEIGDTDHNGVPEFIDGWGRPIRWIRWAPGYVPNVNSPSQPPLSADTDFQRADPPGSASPLSFQPDPFDVRGICRPGGPMAPPGTAPQFYGKPSWGFKLMPLVFSAGPDGEYGVSGMRPLEPDPGPNYDGQTSGVRANPYAWHNGQWRGTPVLGVEGGGHLDNITNHRLGTR